MSTEANRRWSRIDGRMAEARQLLDMWDKEDVRPYVLSRVMTSVRMVAAIVHAANTPARRVAANWICELIARERTP